MVKQMKSAEAGYTLLTVVGVFVILAILGFSIILLSSASVKTSSKERDNQIAFYTAESGVTVEINGLAEEIKDIYDDLPEYVVPELPPGMEEPEYEFAACEVDEVIPDMEDIELPENEREEIFYQKTVDYFSTRPDFKLDKFESIGASDPKATGNVEHVNNHLFKLISTGQVNGETRTVESDFSINWEEEFRTIEINDFALLAKQYIKIPGSNLISGKIGAFGEDVISDKYIDFSGPTNTKFDGEVYLPNKDGTFIETGGVNPNVSSFNEEEDIHELTEFPFPILPSKSDILNEVNDLINEAVTIENLTYNGSQIIQNQNLEIKFAEESSYVLEMEEDMFFNSVSVKWLQTLNIDLQGEDRNLFINKLDLDSAHIRVLPGEGRLNVYVLTDGMKMEGSATINAYDGFDNTIPFQDLVIPPELLNESVDRLNVFYLPEMNPKLNGNAKIFGSFFVTSEQATLNLSESVSIFGNVLSNGAELKITGGTSAQNQLILAPNANIKLESGGKIKGSIIANSIHISGGAEVEFVPPDVVEIKGPLSFGCVTMFNGMKNVSLIKKAPTIKANAIKEKRN